MRPSLTRTGSNSFAVAPFRRTTPGPEAEIRGPDKGLRLVRAEMIASSRDRRPRSAGSSHGSPR